MLSTFSSGGAAGAAALAAGAGTAAAAGASSFLPHAANMTADRAKDQRYFFIIKKLHQKKRNRNPELGEPLVYG
jgi:hypothetical protein